LLTAATNLKEVLEGMSEDPESPMILVAEVAGRAIGLVESVYLYSPEGRRLIEGIIGPLVVGTKYVSEIRPAPEDGSALDWSDSGFSKRV